MHIIQTLPDSDLSPPPPPPGTAENYFYGYKLMNSFDDKSDDDLARAYNIMVAAKRFEAHARIVYNPSVFLVFLAISNPEIGLITPRPGSTKVPCRRLLEIFESEVKADGPPSWFLEDGLIVPPGLAPKNYLKNTRPMKGLWRYSDDLDIA